jgi:hypothetical protein
MQHHATRHTCADTNVEVYVRYAIAIRTGAREALANVRALLLGELRSATGILATIGLTLARAILVLTALLLTGALAILVLTALFLTSALPILVLTALFLTSALAILVLTALFLTSALAILVLTALFLTSALAILVLATLLLTSALAVLLLFVGALLAFSRSLGRATLRLHRLTAAATLSTGISPAGLGALFLGLRRRRRTTLSPGTASLREDGTTHGGNEGPHGGRAQKLMLHDNLLYSSSAYRRRMP